MSVPLATTTFAVLRAPVNVSADFYDQRGAAVPVQTGLRGHISQPAGLERLTDGQEEQVDRPFQTDPADIRPTDQLQDEVTEVVYDVMWAEPRHGLGLDHVVGRVRLVTGAARPS